MTRKMTAPVATAAAILLALSGAVFAGDAKDSRAGPLRVVTQNLWFDEHHRARQRRPDAGLELCQRRALLVVQGVRALELRREIFQQPAQFFAWHSLLLFYCNRGPAGPVAQPRSKLSRPAAAGADRRPCPSRAARTRASPSGTNRRARDRGAGGCQDLASDGAG